MASWRSTMAPPSARTAVSPLAVATGCFSAAIRAAKRLRCCEASSRLATAAVLSPSPGSATCCPEFRRTPSRGLVNYCPTAGNRSLVQPRSELRLYHSIHATGMRFTSRLRLTDEPTATAKELFQRLQARMPGLFTAGQLRTLQRRVKQWRTEIARRLVSGASGDTYPGIPVITDSGQELLK